MIQRMGIVDAAVRSRMMSGIRARDTKPELFIRRGLHALGLRFRVHCSHLPGKPDLSFPRFKVVVFVNGCFWHRHGCSNSKIPKNRLEFWSQKLQANVDRDRRTVSALCEQQWRVATVWECSIRRAVKSEKSELLVALSDWIRHGKTRTLVM